MFVFFPPHLLSFLNLAWPNPAHHAVTHSHLKCCQVDSNIVILHHTTICASQYIIDSLSIPLVAQTCSGQSSHEKPSQTEFEPNQTDVNGFNWFQFQFQKFQLKLNSSVSSLGKNGSNWTKPNFPSTSTYSKMVPWQASVPMPTSAKCHVSWKTLENSLILKDGF